MSLLVPEMVTPAPGSPAEEAWLPALSSAAAHGPRPLPEACVILELMYKDLLKC